MRDKGGGVTRWLTAALALAGTGGLAACSHISSAGTTSPTTAVSGAPTTAATAGTSAGPRPTSTTLAPTTTTRPPATTTTTTVPKCAGCLQLGDSGPKVLAIQKQLTALGYWLGPDNGVFGDSTQQAVWALQKAAGLGRDGIVGPLTEAALDKGVVPTPVPASGNVVEVDLTDDLLMFVDNARLLYTLNCSTGGGYRFLVSGAVATAITPVGVFHTNWAINGADTDSLGTLWRPRFFSGPFAIHGDGDVPPYPVSHGCVRVSDEAIDWIWAENLDPIGTEVWVYGNGPTPA